MDKGKADEEEAENDKKHKDKKKNKSESSGSDEDDEASLLITGLGGGFLFGLIGGFCVGSRLGGKPSGTSR
eukprot:6791355-Pyramimonas_sp.AAC.1